MKINLVLALLIIGVFSFAGIKSVSNLTARSNQQIVIHSSDVNVLTTQVNAAYSNGYRVISTVAQSVSNCKTAGYGYHEIKGEIIVIMEK